MYLAKGYWLSSINTPIKSKKNTCTTRDILAKHMFINKAQVDRISLQTPVKILSNMTPLTWSQLNNNKTEQAATKGFQPEGVYYWCQGTFTWLCNFKIGTSQDGISFEVQCPPRTRISLSLPQEPICFCVFILFLFFLPSSSSLSILHFLIRMFHFTT